MAGSGRSTPVTTKNAGVQGPPAWFRRDWFWGLLLILLVLLAYTPVWNAGFVWDDGVMLTANPCIVGPLGLKEIWTTSAADICPLVITTFWVEHALWGLAPLPYHLANIVMHGACAVALWRVLRSLRVPGAWLGAALWALHPVQVESVAWITEMKNTESCLFFLLSIFFFVKWLNARDLNGRNRGAWYYALSLLFAALAMAGKSSTVILPVVLCLCAWWIEGRWLGGLIQDPHRRDAYDTFHLVTFALPLLSAFHFCLLPSYFCLYSLLSGAHFPHKQTDPQRPGRHRNADADGNSCRGVNDSQMMMAG